MTIVIKRPDKIEVENPQTVQIIKDMQANQTGAFTIDRFTSS